MSLFVYKTQKLLIKFSCSCTEAVPEFSLPFSREVGERANPTLDTMRAVVVHGRKRPKIPETWKTHEVTLCTTCATQPYKL